MGYPTKIELIKRAKSEQWCVNFPSAVAQAIEFERGEVVEWIIDDHQRLVLHRNDGAVEALKKTPEKSLTGFFDAIFGRCRGAFKQGRTFEGAFGLARGFDGVWAGTGAQGKARGKGTRLRHRRLRQNQFIRLRKPRKETAKPR